MMPNDKSVFLTLHHGAYHLTTTNLSFSSPTTFLKSCNVVNRTKFFGPLATFLFLVLCVSLFIRFFIRFAKLDISYDDGEVSSVVAAVGGRLACRCCIGLVTCNGVNALQNLVVVVTPTMEIKISSCIVDISAVRTVLRWDRRIESSLSLSPFGVHGPEDILSLDIGALNGAIFEFGIIRSNWKILSKQIMMFYCIGVNVKQ